MGSNRHWKVVVPVRRIYSRLLFLILRFPVFDASFVVLGRYWFTITFVWFSTVLCFFSCVCVDIGETAVFINTPYASMITSVVWCVKYCHMLTTTIFPSKPGLSDRLVRVVNGSTIPGSLEYCTRSSLCSSHAYPGVFYLTQALPRLMWLFVSGYLVNAATFVCGSLIRDSPSRQHYTQWQMQLNRYICYFQSNLGFLKGERQTTFRLKSPLLVQRKNPFLNIRNGFLNISWPA